MENITMLRCFLRSLFAATFIVAFTGCTKEDTADCPAEFTIVVRAYASNGSELVGNNSPCDVALYVFDNENLFSKRIETTVGAEVAVAIPQGETHTFVAWTDMQGDDSVFPNLTKGKHSLEDCSVSLTPTRSAATVCDSPGDLFNGNIRISSQEEEGVRILPAYRRTGSMAITVRKLREHTQSTDDDFSIVVHETQSCIAFDGTLSGEKNAAYRPGGTFSTQGVYSTGIFNMLPSDEGVTIDLYHHSDLIRSVSLASGEPITVAAGMTTNVLIDFTSLLDVRVSLTQWGVFEIWKDF